MYKSLFRQFLKTTGSVPEIFWKDFFKHDIEIIDTPELSNYFTQSVLPHKQAVYEEGLKLLTFVPSNLHGDYLHNLATHDLSKFSIQEARPYSNYFLDKSSVQFKKDFKLAWQHHKQVNSHHPEYWLSVSRDGLVEPLEMSYLSAVEMVADWLGAGKSYSTPTDEWLKKNIHDFLFHKETQVLLKEILQYLGYEIKIENNRLFCK